MARLFQKGPMTVFMVTKSDQGVLDLGHRTFDRMGKYKFKSIDEGAEESSVGFAVLEDYRSTDFQPGVVEFGDYVVGSVRLDVRKVVKSALDKLHQDMIDAERDKVEAGEDGQIVISKARRKELREQAALKLRAKTVPSIKVVDWWWNQTTGLAYLTDKSKGAVEAFISLFNAAFGPAYELCPVELSNILPNADNVELNVPQDFLTWMWGHRSDSAFLSSGMSFSAYLDTGYDVVVNDNNKKITAKIDDDKDGFTELETAVKLGCRVSKATIRIEHGEENEHWCSFVLDAKMFPLAEVSIPNAKFSPGADFEGALMQQIGTVEEAFAHLRMLLVCYATQHRSETISMGLNPPELAELRDAPDTISKYLEEGQHLLSVRDVHFMTKPPKVPKDEAA